MFVINYQIPTKEKFETELGPIVTYSRDSTGRLQIIYRHHFTVLVVKPKLLHWYRDHRFYLVDSL